MLISLETVRDNLRNREGARVYYLKKGDQLTSAARDFLSRERIPILPAEEAAQERWQLLGGGWCEEKPEHLTHLNGQVLVPKTHPRIAFRGKLDSLEAELILCRIQVPRFDRELGEILNFTRQILRREVLEEAIPEERLCGLTEAEIRHRSHFPQESYGQPHFMPEAADGLEIAYLNRARTAAREAELAAVHAFADRDGIPTRADILRAMNRLSSMLYLLMIQWKGKKL